MTAAARAASEIVTLELRHEAAILRLSRPRVHNAVDEATMARLEAILDELDAAGDARAIVLTGAGRESFCSGGDLRWFASLARRQDGVAMARRMRAILERLATASRPVLAAVNGQALGGGAEILTACDYRVASSAATFAFRQAANGIVTGWGGGPRLVRLVGRAQALRLLLTSERIDAREALRIGLVDEVVEPGRELDAALGLAGRIARNPPGAVRAFLELVRATDVDETQAAERETELFGERWTSPEFRQLLERFSAPR